MSKLDHILPHTIFGLEAYQRYAEHEIKACVSKIKRLQEEIGTCKAKIREMQEPAKQEEKTTKEN